MVNVRNAGDRMPGIDLDLDGQMAFLRILAPLAREWPFAHDPSAGFRYHARNGYFFETDGSVMYALLRHHRPVRVIEIGSGFSSALMLDTADRHLGPDIRFTFIDPYPERLLRLLSAADRDRCEVVTKPIQDVDLVAFDRLGRDDILFIDSSHVSKLASDVNHLVFEVLPRLAPGVLVHVHDIHWPFEYTEGWLRQGNAWNEAYLIRAFLQFNAAFRVLLWPSCLEARRLDEFRAVWPFHSVPEAHRHVSLWLVRTE